MYRQGAVGALLDIYEQAMADFKKVIEDIPDNTLTIIIDPQTTDENCKSIQAILLNMPSYTFSGTSAKWRKLNLTN